jgi:hypothetical protein
MLDIILFIASFFFSVASLGLVLLLMLLVIDAVQQAEDQKLRIDKLLKKTLDK